MQNLNRRVVSFLIGGMLLLTSSAHAESQRRYCTRIPSLSLSDAIELATSKIKKMGSVDEFFVDSVILKCEGKAQIWEIGWRRKAYESGYIIMRVFSDRNIKQKLVKDG